MARLVIAWCFFWASLAACGSTDPEEPLPPRDYFTRQDPGSPTSREELVAVTKRYLELLRETRYFDVTNERAFGWPQSASSGYWFGTWWSGITIEKTGGEITFHHPAKGSDNNGLRTAPILAGACFAHALWGNRERLIQKLVRGFNSWSLAMDRPGNADNGQLLARVHYMPAVRSTDEGVDYFIDYSNNLPGEFSQGELDEPPTIYVHNPDNPHWGDIWIKNKRSKDDVGHMLQAMAHLSACTDSPSPELAGDLELMHERYTAWAKRVEADDWKIATVDENWQTYIPIEQLAIFVQEFNVECGATLAIRYFGNGDSGDLDCGDAISDLSEVWALKKDFHQIERSFHEAAAAMAYRSGDIEAGDKLVSGLAWRLDKIFDAREAGEYPEELNDEDLLELVVMAANAGVPLVSREVQFVHGQIDKAHESYLTEDWRTNYRLFIDAPDGEYVYNPNGSGMFWRYMATLLGQCASSYINPTGRPILDCETVRASNL